MIIIKLREARLQYWRRTGSRMTYEQLAKLTAIPSGTLSAMASRTAYNATLDKIDALCDALDLPLEDLLERRPNPPRKKKRPKRKASKKP